MKEGVQHKITWYHVTGWSLGTGAILRAQCWAWILTDLSLRSSYSQISLGEWKSILYCPCLPSISATLATLFMGQLENCIDDWGKRLTAHKMVQPIYLIIQLLLPGWLYTGHNYLHSLQLFSEIYPHTSFPDVFFTNFQVRLESGTGAKSISQKREHIQVLQSHL